MLHYFSLIVIPYVRKCFRGGTYPENTSYTLVNNCTNFGAFIRYVPIIFLSHLTTWRKSFFEAMVQEQKTYLPSTSFTGAIQFPYIVLFAGFCFVC